MNVVQSFRTAHRRERSVAAAERAIERGKSMRTNAMIAHRGLLAGLAVSLLPCGAWAQVACGGTVGPGETVTLTGDLGPCDDVPAAVTVEGGTLDLGGFTIFCADTDGDDRLSVGVELGGTKAQVRNGTVTGCYSGVRVEGGGKAAVTGVTASNNATDGVQIRSDKNKIKGNTAAGNGDEGFDVLGSRNKITGNTATGNSSDGIDVASNARKNNVVRNISTGNGTADLQDSGAPCKSNTWRKNTYGSRASDCLK
jgi:parallel beta-helix repeat protein